MLLMKSPCGCYEELHETGYSSGRCEKHKDLKPEAPALVDAIQAAVKRLGAGLGVVESSEPRETK